VQELVIKPEITDTNRKNFTVKAMTDSGCTHTCINEKMVIRKDIPRVKLPQPIICTNSDGTISGNKPIMDFVKVKMEINGHQENIDAVITQLDSADTFVGYDWLTKHNPTINCYNLNKFNSGCNERQRLEGEKGIINELVKRKEYRSITTLLI
jgi:hypothetical protein